jgi:hypothetical protein
MRYMAMPAWGALATVVALACGAATCAQAATPSDKMLQAGPAEIAGTVRSASGPEAGVWVIAQTDDLPTRFVKIVVTDDQGRFLLPDLPSASYQVWARGYGLVDAAKVTAKGGTVLELQATPAPSAAAAAGYYPGVYWYAMLEIPPKSDFPGTGPAGNGISPNMKDQATWIEAIKQSCQSCHALGSTGLRTVPALFAEHRDSVAAWRKRVQSGQASNIMAASLNYIGEDRAIRQFARWTDTIAAGALPASAPQRPQGVERNVVVTEWDWSSAKAYQHDAISTDKRNPRVNAFGPIYGSPEESTDLVPVLDPVRNVATEIRHPFKDPKTPSSLDLAKGESAYWGTEKIWDGHTSIHNPIMDAEGRVWFTARIRPPGSNPDFCRKGSSHPSARVAPLDESIRQLSMYEPRTQKWSLIDTCFNTQHLYFANDKDNTLWISQTQPMSGVTGWFNTRKYLETGDDAASQGWTPIVVDTNGNGKRDEFVGPKDPIDPSKDKWVAAAFYGVQPSTVDGTIWGQSMGAGFSRFDQPSFLIHLIPGPDPAQTSLSELFRPPGESFGTRGLDLDSHGVVWTPLASGELASFDRRKCKGGGGVLGGPDAVTGRLCPEGWTMYRFPGPQFKGVAESGSADQAYYVWVDRFDTLGLGRDVPIVSSNGNESLLALVDGRFVNIHVPYPMPFFTKNVDGRIDDPDGGWKGKGLWTTSGTRANFHGEGGKEARPKVFKIQVRPDPLAH